ncbi:hypothetical protein [Candidatus Lokiarchaeum ossiferum]|uniref:hypothetical protein n=1 Tax=Candidatus Lokiarchaeum ossiferum TaxID=2951803 RepID=UPI00352D198E
MEKKALKYGLKLYIDGKRIATKPFILNTLGNVCHGFFTELNEVTEDRVILLEIFSKEPQCKQVIMKCGEFLVEIKPFVQDLIMKTLLGFISSLNGLPESFPHSPVKIEYQVKN